MTQELHICWKWLGRYIPRESWHNIQIAFTTNCMTGGQDYSVYEYIPTAKYDSDLCFLPDSSGYLRSYLVGRIQNWRRCYWSVGTGRHIFWSWREWRLHIEWWPWITSRDSDGKCWDTFMRVKRWTEEGLGACPCSVFTWYAVGVSGNKPSLLRPSWRPQKHGGGEMRST